MFGPHGKLKPSLPVDSSPDREKLICNLCGADDAEPFIVATERRFQLGGQFQYVQCQRCGLIYMNPRPAVSALAAWYPDMGYYAHQPVNRARGPYGQLRLAAKRVFLAAHKNYPLPRNRLLRFLTRVIKLIPYQPVRLTRLPSYTPGGKALDVGCGNGNYLYSLRELGWQVIGVEPDVKAARFARTELGLDVRPVTLEKAGLDSESVDVAFMLHVLEHVPNPLRTLQEIRRVLKPGGYLVIETPNVASWTARLFSSWWFHLDAPRHLYLFTPQTLSALLRSAGFCQVDVAYLAITSGITGSLQYLWNALTGNPHGNRIRHSRALACLCQPMVWLGTKLGSSDIIRAIAQKQERLQ